MHPAAVLFSLFLSLFSFSPSFLFSFFPFFFCIIAHQHQKKCLQKRTRSSRPLEDIQQFYMASQTPGITLRIETNEGYQHLTLANFQLPSFSSQEHFPARVPCSGPDPSPSRVQTLLSVFFVGLLGVPKDDASDRGCP